MWFPLVGLTITSTGREPGAKPAVDGPVPGAGGHHVTNRTHGSRPRTAGLGHPERASDTAVRVSSWRTRSGSPIMPNARLADSSFSDALL